MVKVTEILKLRWPEAVMLIGLFTGLSALGARIVQDFPVSEEMAARLPFWSLFLLGLSLMLLIILMGMLFLGFLRSIVLEPLIPRAPIGLLRLGQPFFWKIFLFYMVFEMAWTLLTVLLAGMIYGLLHGPGNPAQYPEWLLRLSQVIVLVMLIKPFLLIPSIILLKNQPIWVVLAEFREISLFKMHVLMKTIAAGFGLLLAVLVPLYLIPFSKQFFWIRVGILSMVTGSVFLFLFVSTLLEIRDRSKMEHHDNL